MLMYSKMYIDIFLGSRMQFLSLNLHIRMQGEYCNFSSFPPLGAGEPVETVLFRFAQMCHVRSVCTQIPME